MYYLERRMIDHNQCCIVENVRQQEEKKSRQETGYHISNNIKTQKFYSHCL